MDFNSQPPILSHHDFILKTPLAGICSKNGQLIGYTDGCDIANRTHDIMLNGDTLSPGEVFNEFCDNDTYPVYQGALFLPHPDSTNLYYLLYFLSDDVSWNPRYLLYSLINSKEDNGFGEVIHKNEPIFEDYYLNEYITATRHANGRDWWIIAPRRNSNVYTRCLLTPEGAQYLGAQAIGSAEPVYWGGQTCFSPDGSVYVKALIDGLRVMDFNRCTGQFSNYRFIPSQPTAGAGGCVFSPSGRFLYTTDGTFLYQYDYIWASDLEASRQVIAQYDGYKSPFSTAFYQCGLAPDGKIYISTGSTNNVMHIIHQPDQPGADCQVEQHGLQLPALMGWFVPNFVNYHLGPLDCSACDTLNLDNLPQAAWTYEVDTLNPLHVQFRDLSTCTLQWRWQFGDGPASSKHQHPDYTFSAPGTYVVCLTATNANGSDTWCDTVRVFATAQQDPTLDRRLDVWPNPFRDQLNVMWSARLPSPVFRLFDTVGRVVFSAPLAYGFSEFEPAGLPPGLYYWEVATRGERVKTGKVVKTGH